MARLWPGGLKPWPPMITIRLGIGQLSWDYSVERAQGAGEGNRTLMTSLEGWGSAIELRPRDGKAAIGSVPGRQARPGRERVRDQARPSQFPVTGDPSPAGIRTP